MSAASAARQEAATPFYADGRRSRDLARELGISEAELLAAHDGPEVVRLAFDPGDLLAALPGLGEVMCLTRNEAAVHEKVGAFGNVSASGGIGLVLNDAIDLRLFLRHWRTAFAVEIPGEEGPRRSLQVFDGSGEAVVKVHLRPASDAAAFAALRDRLADPRPGPLALAPAGIESAPAISSADGERFRAAFAGMRDVHEFAGLLKRFGLSRRGALDHMDGHARPLGERAARSLLERAAARAEPIMCFVGNRGCIQIHHGPVATVKVMGPWVNVLDPGFNLHLREDLVAEAWLVKKPTRHGLVTSVELYAGDASLIAQFFGVRDEESPEVASWRTLAESL